MPCSEFVAHAISAVSVGVRCCMRTFRGQPAASSFPSSPGSQILVPYSLLLFVVWGDIEVSPVLFVVAAYIASVPLRSIEPSSFLSSLMSSSSSPRVHWSSLRLRLVAVIIQDQGVIWEAWGPVTHEGP